MNERTNELAWKRQFHELSSQGQWFWEKRLGEYTCQAERKGVLKEEYLLALGEGLDVIVNGPLRFGEVKIKLTFPEIKDGEEKVILRPVVRMDLDLPHYSCWICREVAYALLERATAPSP